MAAKKKSVKKRASVKRKPKKKPNGRPTDYSKRLSNIICSRIACGESMRSISRDEKMPCMATLFRWLSEKKKFKEQYVIAKTESADVHADDMLDIADNQVSQPLLNEEGKPAKDSKGDVIMVISAIAVQHARLRVDARKWVSSKLKPKKYGDKMHLAGDEDNPVVVTEVKRTIIDPKK